MSKSVYHVHWRITNLPLALLLIHRHFFSFVRIYRIDTILVCGEWAQCYIDNTDVAGLSLTVDSDIYTDIYTDISSDRSWQHPRMTDSDSEWQRVTEWQIATSMRLTARGHAGRLTVRLFYILMRGRRKVTLNLVVNSVTSSSPCVSVTWQWHDSDMTILFCRTKQWHHQTR